MVGDFVRSRVFCKDCTSSQTFKSSHQSINQQGLKHRAERHSFCAIATEKHVSARAKNETGSYHHVRPRSFKFARRVNMTICGLYHWDWALLWLAQSAFKEQAHFRTSPQHVSPSDLCCSVNLEPVTKSAINRAQALWLHVCSLPSSMSSARKCFSKILLHSLRQDIGPS